MRETLRPTDWRTAGQKPWWRGAARPALPSAARFHERRESSRQRVHVRKEQLVEHERRRGSVQEEVIPLDRGSDKARQYYSSNGSRFLGILFCPHVSPLSIPRVEYHEHRHSAALTA